MKKLVLDSSVIIKWLNTVRESHTEQADKILSEAIEGKIELLAPELAKYEISNALLLSKKLSAREIKTPLKALYSYPITFIKLSRDLANETYQIAARKKITFYAASFIALAEQENATLVTENLKHQGKNTRTKVLSLADYGSAGFGSMFSEENRRSFSCKNSTNLQFYK
jgi:predicted nucleic acid-binding protein